MTQAYEHRPSLVYSLCQDLDMMINEFSNAGAAAHSSAAPPQSSNGRLEVCNGSNETSDDDNDEDDMILSLPSIQGGLAAAAASFPPSPPHEKDHALGREQPSNSTVARLSSQRSSNSDVPTNPALMSVLAGEFVRGVQELNSIRRLYCSDEYPLSFTGEEALRIMKETVPFELKAGQYKKVARAFMHTSPPLIAPTSYAEKSLRKNTLYDLASEIYTVVLDAADGGYPHGVYTPLAACYSQTCTPGFGGCYSVSCPNRKKRSRPASLQSGRQSPVRRSKSATSSSVASSHDTAFSKAWQATVPVSVLKDTPKKEIERQEAIYELIYTEDNYVRDLNLLDEIYARTLRTAQCIDEGRRDAFCDNIFNNYQELLAMHKDLFRDLHDHQLMCQDRTAGGFVDRVGHILLRHVDRFMGAYTRYGPHVPIAEYAVKRETGSNMLFQNFVREREKQAECRKLPFRHFLITPVSRLQRYPLLLKAILAKTPDDHPDHPDLVRCVDLIGAVCERADELTIETRMKLSIYEIDDTVKFKPGTPYIDLRLSEKGRRLLHSGQAKRRVYMEEMEHHLYLFDHLLLITKPKNNQSFVWRRPIPLELLSVRASAAATSGSAPTCPTQRSWSTQSMVSPTATSPAAMPPSSSTLVIRHLGNPEGDYTFQVSSAQNRSEWMNKILDAKAAFDKAHPERRVFEIKALSDTTFTTTSGPASNGKVTCSTAFVGARGKPMVAIGTEHGVWMGAEGDVNRINKVLSVANVMQVAVLQEYHIFLVLADKVLMAYPLDTLDPTAPSSAPLGTRQKIPSYKISSSVSFFQAGVCDRRALVVIKKKKGVDSVFSAMEPVCGDLRDPKNSKFLNTKTGLLSRAPSWFKSYKDFYIGAESSAIHILNKRLAIVCERGFEIISLDSLRNHPLPDLEDPDFQFVQKRQDHLVPLGMYRCQNNYLLCYNDFAFLVDMKGRYIHGQPRIDWHGTPRAVAFCYPYVIAFDPSFIEVWHAETSELIQVLEGENMRILQDKPGMGASSVIHGCMTHSLRPDYHHVFSLAATSSTPYFASR